MPILTGGELPQINRNLPKNPPVLERFTREEMEKIPRTAHVKILDYQAEVWGCFDIYKSAVQEWELWAKNVFKVKQEPPKDTAEFNKKWFQFWK